MAKLSSGQREKAYLAKMLLEEKDFLIMDEPTNFLDATQVDWLARYLISYPKAFLVVSHDQEFLKRIATVVFCLENQTVTRYAIEWVDEFDWGAASDVSALTDWGVDLKGSGIGSAHFDLVLFSHWSKDGNVLEH